MTSLNPNELEALRILWEQGELKPAEIQALFSWHIENATLRSALVNLVGKKHVTRRLQGKAFHYAARIPKATLLQTTMQTMARVFAGGSHRELVLQLLETSDIKAADLELIAKPRPGLRPRRQRGRQNEPASLVGLAWVCDSAPVDVPAGIWLAGSLDLAAAARPLAVDSLARHSLLRFGFAAAESILGSRPQDSGRRGSRRPGGIYQLPCAAQRNYISFAATNTAARCGHFRFPQCKDFAISVAGKTGRLVKHCSGDLDIRLSIRLDSAR